VRSSEVFLFAAMFDSILGSQAMDNDQLKFNRPRSDIPAA